MPKKQQREFDFSKHAFRKVALRVCYLGWDAEGFCVQDTTENTIEARLFAALLKTKLVAARAECDYHRCGRTDKGVSSAGQVVSLRLRSALSADDLSASPPRVDGELNYPLLLNRVLPPEIRVLSWAPVDDDGFSARFNCTARTYRYYFPRGTLDLAAMEQACSFLLGEHDFRNFCKMDVSNGVMEFVRTIFSANVVDLAVTGDATVACSSETTGYDMCYLEIVGKAFLWHQIRCIVAVLVVVGEGKEQPNVVIDLLDVAKCPSKPQYTMALDYPLNLYDCTYDDDSLNWQMDDFTRRKLTEHFQSIWMELSIKATMVRDVLRTFESSHSAQAINLIPGSKPKTYKRLADRPKCDDLQMKLMKFESKNVE